MAVLLRSLRGSILAVIGATMCLGSWTVAMLLSFDLLGSVLFSIPNAEEQWAHLPLIPYLGMFLIGMALSKHLESVLLAQHNPSIARRLTTIGMVAVVAVLGSIAAWRYAKGYLPDA